MNEIFNILREIQFHGYNLDFSDGADGLKFCLQFNEEPSKGRRILEQLRELAREKGFKFFSEQISRNIFKVAFYKKSESVSESKVIKAKRLLESLGYSVRF